MFDSNIAIVVADVSRMFKRYRRPRHRVMEAFGLPLSKGACDEFWALRGISLELQRGDSVGLIGQNGAGKSTLLNIVCGRLQPSLGSVTVRGNVQALMELGTGFHPEFSGRQTSCPRSLTRELPDGRPDGLSMPSSTFRSWMNSSTSLSKPIPAACTPDWRSRSLPRSYPIS